MENLSNQNTNLNETENSSFGDHNNQWDSYETYSDTSKEYQKEEENPTPSSSDTHNFFAVLARNLGIFAVFCALFSFFFGTLICGGLAVILALLSKGYHTKMSSQALIGFTAGILSIVLQIGTFAVSLYNIIYIPEYREQFNSIYEQIYGEPLDDSINNFLNEMGLPSQEGDIL